MKKTFIIFLLMCFGFSSAQLEENRFKKSENGDRAVISNDEDLPGGPGDPPGSGDLDLPINDCLPLLVLTAAGLIVYYSKKQKLSAK